MLLKTRTGAKSFSKLSKFIQTTMVVLLDGNYSNHYDCSVRWKFAKLEKGKTQVNTYQKAAAKVILIYRQKKKRLLRSNELISVGSLEKMDYNNDIVAFNFLRFFFTFIYEIYHTHFV